MSCCPAAIPKGGRRKSTLSVGHFTLNCAAYGTCDQIYKKWLIALLFKRRTKKSIYDLHGEDVYAGPRKTDQERFDIGIKAIGEKWARAGYELVPVIVPEFGLQCSLDILLLRPEGNRAL